MLGKDLGNALGAPAGGCIAAAFRVLAWLGVQAVAGPDDLGCAAAGLLAYVL